jgi:hypothetical protein
MILCDIIHFIYDRKAGFLPGQRLGAIALWAESPALRPREIANERA